MKSRRLLYRFLSFGVCQVVLLAATNGTCAETALPPPVNPSPTFTSAKAILDSGNLVDAAAAFNEALESGPENERPADAAFLIHTYFKAGMHWSVVHNYDRCFQAAQGTPYEAACALDLAKSTNVNAKDTTVAITLFNNVIANYKSNEPVAVAAFLELSDIQRVKLFDPMLALQTIGALKAAFPKNDEASEVLLAEGRCASALADVDLMNKAFQRLSEVTSPNDRPNADALTERADFEFNRSGDIPGACEIWQEIVNRWPDSIMAANARIRLADHVPTGDFSGAINEYRAVLAGPAKLSKASSDWARVQIGIYFFQLGDKAAAREAFEQVLAQRPAKRYESEAQRYLYGMENHDSTSALTIIYDRAARFRQTNARLDKAYWDYQRVMVLSKKEFFSQYVNDAKQDKEERAQILYQVAFANYSCGYSDKAYEMAGNILSDVQPEKVTKYECLYMRAYLLGRGGHFAEAAAGWKGMIESDPKIDFLPQSYIEYSRALHLSGDRLGAVLALEELKARFPVHQQSKVADSLILTHLLVEPNLKQTVAAKVPDLLTKWKPKMRRTSPGDQDDLADVPTAPALTGGAQ